MPEGKKPKLKKEYEDGLVGAFKRALTEWNEEFQKNQDEPPEKPKPDTPPKSDDPPTKPVDVFSHMFEYETEGAE